MAAISRECVTALDRAAPKRLDVRDQLGRQDHSGTSKLLPAVNNDYVETLTAARSYSQRPVNLRGGDARDKFTR